MNISRSRILLSTIALSLFSLCILSVCCTPATTSNNPATGADISIQPSTASGDSNSNSQRIYNEYGRRLEITANLVNTLLEAAGEAHGDGTLSDAQLEKIRTLGHQLEAAFDTAKSTLKLYIATSGSVSESDKASLSDKMLAYDRLVIQLQETLRQGGVI